LYSSSAFERFMLFSVVKHNRERVAFWKHHEDVWYFIYPILNQLFGRLLYASSESKLFIFYELMLLLLQIDDLIL
jgi:hypothetical protein